MQQHFRASCVINAPSDFIRRDDMNKLLLAVSGLVALGGSAFAADMPLKAPMVPPAPFMSWTGCNLNAGVGYGFLDQTHYGETLPGLAPLTATIDSAGRGWLGRFGAGCDYQLGGGLSNWVIGAFGDYDAMDIHGFSDVAGIGGNAKESSAWYAGGRVGYLVTPQLLTYFDGGYTETRFGAVGLSASAVAPPLPLGANLPSHTYNGWFLGGGTEYALNFSWLPIHGLFWRSEYRYSDYRSTDLPIVITATGALTGAGEHTQNRVQTITSSLVWRFNWLGH
jgi:outer membrane immunogenic protein